MLYPCMLVTCCWDVLDYLMVTCKSAVVQTVSLLSIKERSYMARGGGRHTGLVPHRASLQEAALMVLMRSPLLVALPTWNSVQLSQPREQWLLWCLLFTF